MLYVTKLEMNRHMGQVILNVIKTPFQSEFVVPIQTQAENVRLTGVFYRVP